MASSSLEQSIQLHVSDDGSTDTMVSDCNSPIEENIASEAVSNESNESLDKRSNEKTFQGELARLQSEWHDSPASGLLAKHLKEGLFKRRGFKITEVLCMGLGRITPYYCGKCSELHYPDQSMVQLAALTCWVDLMRELGSAC